MKLFDLLSPEAIKAPMDGPAPAVINAVCNALGVQLDSIPLTPELLMTKLEGATL